VATRWWKKFEDCSFWHDPRTWQTDGRTDRQTDGQTDTAWRHKPRLCISSRGKNCDNILAVSIEYWNATDRRSDRQTDRQNSYINIARRSSVCWCAIKRTKTHKLLNVNCIACLQPVCKKWSCVHSIVYNNQLVHNTAENSPHNNFSSSPPNDHRRSERRIMCNKRVSLNGDREPQALSRLFIRSTWQYGPALVHRTGISPVRQWHLAGFELLYSSLYIVITLEVEKSIFRE